MAKKAKLKLPKKIGGVKLPKKARKAANELLKPFGKSRYQPLAAAVVGAVLEHYLEARSERSGANGDDRRERDHDRAPTLPGRVKRALGGQLSH